MDKRKLLLIVIGCAFCILFTLKVARVDIIDQWNWIWITTPIWLPASFIVLLVVYYGLKFIIFSWLKTHIRRKKFTTKNG